MDKATKRLPSETSKSEHVIALVIAAATVAVGVWAALYFPDRDDGSGAMLGAIFGFVAAMCGLAALSRVRPLPERSTIEHARLAGLAVILGIVLGVANLLTNYAIATSDPGIYEGMVKRWAGFDAWSMVVADPVMEEIAFRLVLMSLVALLVSRFTANRQTQFYIALAATGVLFGLVHILYSTPLTETVSVMHATGIVVKSGAAGMLLGWVFWRWGLPYSIACHCTANAVHLLLIPVLF